jgi:hypothetical protein
MKPLSIIAYASVRPFSEPDWDKDIPAAQKRRNPRIWQMASRTASRALSQSSLTPESLIVATALGALDETRLFLEGIFIQGNGAPRNFISSVHNSMAGKIAIDLKIPGPNLTVCDGQNSLASAIKTASLLNVEDMPVLIIAVDETLELLQKLSEHFADNCKPFLSSIHEDGAVAFLCNHQSTTALPRFSSIGPLPVSHNCPQSACIELAAKYLKPGCSIIDASQASTSFIKPAFTVEDILRHNQKSSRYAIGAYCPSATAASLIEVCV